MRNLICQSFCFVLFLTAFPVLLFAQLRAGFTADGKAVGKGDTLHVCTGNSVSYNSTATGFSSIIWKFDNGTGVSTEFGFGPYFISYSKTGVYKTVQTVTSASNAKDSIRVFVKVSDKDPKLKAAFSYTPNTSDQCGSEDYNFNSSGSSGAKLTYYWDFGDQTNSTTANPVHQFTTAIGVSGTQAFAVTLTVTDANGCSDVTNKPVTVLKIPDASLTNDPVNADFNPVPFNGLATFQKCEKLSTYGFIFKNNSTTTSINTKYDIDWGDGSTAETHDDTWSTGSATQHTYSLGLHVLTIQVTGKNNCVTTRKYNVFLGSAPGGLFGGKKQRPGFLRRQFCQFLY